MSLIYQLLNSLTVIVPVGTIIWLGAGPLNKVGIVIALIAGSYCSYVIDDRCIVHLMRHI